MPVIMSKQSIARLRSTPLPGLQISYLQHTRSPSQANSSKQTCRAPSTQRKTTIRVQAISIDRRKHLDLAWQRQQQQERRGQVLQEALHNQIVVDIKNLQDLDKVNELIGNNILVVFFYSRSCGSCKQVLGRFETLCQQAAKEKAGISFAQHDVRNEYDDVSDLSRFYSVKAVPAFVFFVGGAPVRRITMRDVRRLTGTSKQVRAAMEEDLHKLGQVVREVLFRNAPSARP